MTNSPVCVWVGGVGVGVGVRIEIVRSTTCHSRMNWLIILIDWMANIELLYQLIGLTLISHMLPV